MLEFLFRYGKSRFVLYSETEFFKNFLNTFMASNSEISQYFSNFEYQSWLDKNPRDSRDPLFSIFANFNLLGIPIGLSGSLNC